MEAADFSGYATKAGLRCSDGRTIMPDAFRKQHQQTVPLVWMHGHKDPENVLGHAILENREDGVYAYAFFNKSPKAQHMKAAVDHRDITQLSIWANELIERSSQVLHGVIREVSLVLAGANPGAMIDPISIVHSDGGVTELDDSAIITTGLEIVHGDEAPHIIVDDSDDKSDDSDDKKEDDDKGGDADADSDKDGDKDTKDDDSKKKDDKKDDDKSELKHALSEGSSLQDVLDTMNDAQLEAVHYLVGEAMTGSEDANDNAAHSGTSQEGSTMHNVFEGDDTKKDQHVLTHDAMQGIMQDAQRLGSMKAAVEGYAIKHGIENIDVMFPDAKALDNTPQFKQRRMEWVEVILGGTHKTPFSRIKSLWADITGDEARARGYIKGTLKKEEFFSVAKRITTPTTVYKKQALDRDDVVDITDFNVVAWLKAEMRMMLDEEVARAILLGDGRAPESEDKINPDCIRPVASDHELYSTKLYVNINDANSSFQEVIDLWIKNRKHYRGTGNPVMFTSETYIAMAMLMKDGIGRRLYRTLDELAAELRVEKIVPVEVLEDYPEIVAIIFNPWDYNVGADKGGEVNMFDDFDIDYNKHKYLVETRLSGALVKLKSAVVIRKVAGNATLVAPTAPTFNEAAGEITIPTQTGVVYKNVAGTTLTTGSSPYTVPAGETYKVFAFPSSGSYYFESTEEDEWEFYNSNS